MTAKTEALTPMARASAATAATVNRRSLTSIRIANRMSCEMSWNQGQTQTSRARFMASASLPNAR